MDFTQSFLQGVQQGQQRASQKKAQERADEEFDLKKQMLQVEMKKLDIAQKVAARRSAIEEADKMKDFDVPAQVQGSGAITPTGGPMPAVDLKAIQPTAVPVNIPAGGYGEAPMQVMAPTRTGIAQAEESKFNRQQGAIEARSKVFVQPGDPTGLPPGPVDREIYVARTQSAALDQRLEAQANNIQAQIAAAAARTEAQIAAGDRRAAATNEAAERRLFLQGKAVASAKPGAAETQSFITQPGFNTLAPPDRTKAVMMNGIIGMAKSYRDLVADMVGPSGIKIMGEDAAVLEAIHAKLMFEGAAGWGQGALQAPDLAQMKKTFYDPTSLKDAFGTTIKGQKEGRLKAMDKVIEDLALKMKTNYGLTPMTGDMSMAPTSGGTPTAAPVLRYDPKTRQFVRQ